MMPTKFWTPDRVIEELDGVRCNGLCASHELDDAARIVFGAVGAALAMATLPCGQSAGGNRDWFTLLVFKAVLQRYCNDESLVRTKGEEREICEAVAPLHRIWVAAFAIAGFPQPSLDYHMADEVAKFKVKARMAQ